jgi:hypothetical protein
MLLPEYHIPVGAVECQTSLAVLARDYRWLDGAAASSDIAARNLAAYEHSGDGQGQGGFRPGNASARWGAPDRGRWLSLVRCSWRTSRAIYARVSKGLLKFARASTDAESQTSVLAGASTLVCPNGKAEGDRSGDLPTPTSCKSQQTSASGNQAGQAGTYDGSGNNNRIDLCQKYVASCGRDVKELKAPRTG